MVLPRPHSTILLSQGALSICYRQKEEDKKCSFFFLDEVQDGTDAAHGRGVGPADSWSTPEVMQHCKFYEMVNVYRGNRKSPVLAVFTFDGDLAIAKLDRSRHCHLCARFSHSMTPGISDTGHKAGRR